MSPSEIVPEPLTISGPATRKSRYTRLPMRGTVTGASWTAYVNPKTTGPGFTDYRPTDGPDDYRPVYISRCEALRELLGGDVVDRPNRDPRTDEIIGWDIYLRVSFEPM